MARAFFKKNQAKHVRATVDSGIHAGHIIEAANLYEGLAGHCIKALAAQTSYACWSCFVGVACCVLFASRKHKFLTRGDFIIAFTGQPISFMTPLGGFARFFARRFAIAPL